ncbi:MAG: hypothetical protein ACPG7B_15415, partial [Pseudomonadales bacterium]
YYVLLPPGSIQGQVPEDVLFRLGVVDGPFAMIWGLIAAFFYAGYRINKTDHQRIQAQLMRFRYPPVGKKIMRD